MKTLHLSIITGLGIVAMIAFAFILMGYTSQQIRIEGVNDTYKVGDTINATVFYSKQQPPCTSPQIVLRNATNQSQTIWETPGGSYEGTACRDNWWTEFYAGINGYSVINHTQSYVIYASLGNQHIEKEFTVYTDPSRKYYTEIQVSGPNPTPAIEIPIGFKITIKGHGIFDAGQSPDVSITDGNGTTIWRSPTELVLCCPAEMSYYNFTLDTNTRWNPIILNKSGTYLLKVSYNDKTVEKKFTVVQSSTTVYDTGILPYSIKVGNTNFTVNYDIKQGQVSGIKLAKPSGALEILLQTTGNGVITIEIPRALIDARGTNFDDQFFVLADGEEISFKEIHKTIQDRTLSIPFQQGTEKIEIIETYPI